MENLSRLVSDSLAQNGVRIALNHQRLEWSRWFRCESSFSVLLAPSKPGIFALGEEIIAPAIGEVELRAPSPAETSRIDVELRAPSPVETSRHAGADNSRVGNGKRMLALFEVVETSDLGLALGRLFLPRSPLREKLECGRSFARFTVIEDASERASAYAALRNWMDQSAETASGLSTRDQNDRCGAGALARENDSERAIPGAQVADEPQPSLSFPWGMEAPQRELNEKKVGPRPLPSGF
jgi:hypothetical protein